MNALYPRTPPTAATSTASTAATINPATAAKATTSSVSSRGPMSSASGSGSDSGSGSALGSGSVKGSASGCVKRSASDSGGVNRSRGCKMRKTFANVSDKTIVDDVRNINGGVKAIWDGLEKVTKLKKGTIELNLKRQDGRASVVYHKGVRDLLQAEFSEFYEKYPTQYYIDAIMKRLNLKFTKRV